MAQLQYIERFPFPDTTSAKPWGGTKLPFGQLNMGIAVDPAGNVWIQPYTTTGVDSIEDGAGGYVATRPIYVLKPDGTPTAFSPIHVLSGDTEANAAVTDTLTGRLGYGAAMDPSTGNIGLVWNGGLVWKIDYKTGAGIRRTLAPAGLGANSPASIAFDDAGEAFLAPVATGLPGIVLNPDFTVAIQFTSDIGADFGRAIAVSGDGNDVYVPRFTALKTYVYHSASGSLGPYSLTDSLFLGAFVESIAIHPVTGHIWFAAGTGSTADSTVLNYTWTRNMFYGYDPVGETLVDSFSVALDSHGDTLWNAATTILPRGMAFTPTGDTLYVAHFNNFSGIEAIQRFIRMDPTSVERLQQVPSGFELKQNFPNPFNPSTEIRFSITEAGQTSLIVYDMLGRQVRGLVNGNLPAGSYTVTFNAGDLASGTYIYVLQSGSVRMTKKMVLMK